MLSIITPSYIVNIIINLFIFALLICVYTYLLKLEKAGNCDCAFKYPYVGFIKSFTIFAFIFLIFTMFIPHDKLSEFFGPQIAGIYIFIVLIFYILFAVYIFMTMDYTRLLIREKCKCSQDIRRELIFAGSTIELILIFIALLVLTIFPILSCSLSVIFTNLKTFSNNVETNLKNPVKGIKNVPNQLSKVSNQVKDIVKSSSKSIKRLNKK